MLESKINFVPDTLTVNKLVRLNSCQPLRLSIHCTTIDFIDNLLLDFSLTVKAATLIFISGCGSAISSAKEGK